MRRIAFKIGCVYSYDTALIGETFQHFMTIQNTTVSSHKEDKLYHLRF